MDVTLRPDLEKFVLDQVRSGRFGSVEDALNAAVERLRAERDALDGKDDIRAEVLLGIAAADRGEFAEFTAEDVIAERRAALAAKKPSQ